MRARSTVFVLAAALSAMAVIGAGCGGSSSNSTTTTAAPASTSAATTTATAAGAASSTTATGDLSGTWNGQYSGAYQGSFVLNWQQSGSSLNGTIKLSAPSSTLSVNGTLQGGSIRFGTVGSVAITYTGSVSGNSMSGTYHTPGGGGPWSANKG